MYQGVNYQLFRLQAQEKARRIREAGTDDFREGWDAAIKFWGDYLDAREQAFLKDIQAERETGGKS